jgi:fructose-1-phosphate kinase PfkB-like protein
VATPMTPFTSVTKTRLGDCALAGCATAAAMHSSTKPANRVGQACPVEQARHVKASHVKQAAIGPLMSRPTVTRARLRTRFGSTSI